MESKRRRANRRLRNQPISADNAARLAGEYLNTIEPYPETFCGRGIVTCAGGSTYNICAWVLIKMLRHLGCELPIEVWYLDESERDDAWISLVEPLGVECVNARLATRQHFYPRLEGWSLKPHAILHSPFEEVLLLDADNVPVLDPTYLFDDPRYRATGAIFWPDRLRTPPQSERWKIFGVEYRNEWEQESGQILIDKRHCWAPLKLCNWYNQRADFFYEHVYGDKDTFRFAWHRTGQKYTMPERGVLRLRHTVCQHDLDGRRLFQHRCLKKWSLEKRSRRVRGFQYHDECARFLRELQERWKPLGPNMTETRASHR